MHYVDTAGRRILDGTAAQWCCNAGNGREPIIAAIRKQAATLDFCAPFQSSHPKALQLASRIAALAPGDLDHVFFTNSGSDAVFTIVVATFRSAQRI